MKNWRTFALGLGGAIFFAIEPVLQNGTFNIHHDWPNLVCAGGSFLFGNAAKDAQVTGLPNDTTPKG